MAPVGRLCIFCGAPANSEEHFWSKWLHPVIGSQASDARHNRRFFKHKRTETTSVTGPRDRQGDPRTIRIKAVCAQCNNGWMNQIEERARTKLTTISLAEVGNIDRADLEAVARWIALKSIIVEHEISNEWLTPVPDRRRFMTEQIIPNYYRIFVASNGSEHRLWLKRKSGCIVSLDGTPKPPLDGATHNLHVITFIIGRAVVQLIAARCDNFRAENLPLLMGFHDRCMIWPNTPLNAKLPIGPLLDELQISKVADVLDTYAARPDLVWVP